jgi:hypothetical protein
MRSLLMLVALATSSCKSRTDATPQKSSGSSAAPATAEPDEPETNTPADRPLTTAEIGQRYRACLGFANDASWAAYAGCYGERHSIEMPGKLPWLTVDEEIVEAKRRGATYPGYRREPQFVMYGLGGGANHVFAILLITGSRGGASFAALAGHHVVFDGADKIERDVLYLDERTLTGDSERPPATPWTTKLDLPLVDKPADKTGELTAGDVQAMIDQPLFVNMRTHGGLLDALSGRSKPRIETLLADDLVWSDQALPADLDKTTLQAHVADGRKTAQVKYDNPVTFGDDEFIAAIESVVTTPATGDPTSFTQLAVYRLERGTLKQAWVFRRPKPAPK